MTRIRDSLYFHVLCLNVVFSATTPPPCPTLNPKTFATEGVVPDVIDTIPAEGLCVTYENQVAVINGNELTPKQVKTEPQLSWGNVKQDKFYLLSMVDPDVPSRAEPAFRSGNHWLVGNILGGDLTTGETLVEYVGSGPRNGTGLHRYVFLVFEQPEKLTFTNETHVKKEELLPRAKFSIRDFAKKYNLGAPIAGNFYVAQWDESVPPPIVIPADLQL